MAADESSVPPLETAKTAVKELYEFRDHYFENFPIERAKFKTKDVEEHLNVCLQKLEKIKDQIDKSEFLMLRGKSLNVLPQYNSEAQELLSKAVKLEPKLVEAWIQLGEVYWKNRDIEAAKNCFTGALSHAEDKVALRNLSMVLRQLGRTQTERLKLIEESTDKAKASVQLDITDGTSWFILGNAYMSMFFASGQPVQVLKQCIRAYQQAEKDPVCQNNPDLHFNKATIDKYQEDYQLALEGFSLSAALDPTWEEPPIQEKQLLDYLRRVSELISSKGKIKGKRLVNMLESLKDSDLGPYAGGSYSGPGGKVVTLTPTPLSQLQPEHNTEKVILGKVVCSLVTDDPVLFTFCLVDRDSTCYSVTVYNIATGYGMKIGDSVAIPEPYLKVIDFSYKGQHFQFKNIRVDSPVILVVNGRKQGLNTQAPTILSVQAKSE